MIKRTIWHPDEIVWCLIVLQPVFVIMINLCFFCGKLYFVEKNCRGLMLFSFLWNSISGSPTACFKSMINDKFWRQIWVLFHTIFMELLKTNVHAINLKNTFRMHLWKSLQVKCLCFHLFSVSNCCCCWPANILSHISSNFALQFGPDFCGGAVLKYYFAFVTFFSKNLGKVDLRYWVTMIWKWSHILLHFAATQHWNKVAYIFHWRKFDIFTLFKILAKIIGKHHKEHLISIFIINLGLEDMPIKYTSDRESLVSKKYSI